MADNEQTDQTKMAVDKFLAEVNGLGFVSLTSFGTKWIEAMGDLSSEVLSFVAERVKEDVQTQHALLHAKDMTEIQKIQSAFLQKALDQYTDETGKLIGLSKELMPSVPPGVVTAD